MVRALLAAKNMDYKGISMGNLSFKAICAVLLLGLSHYAVALSFSMHKHDFDDHFMWVNQDLGMPRIYAEGQIEPGDAARLYEVVTEAGLNSGIVLFNSPGGSLADGILLGEAVRELGLSTGIARFENQQMVKSGVCASACAYAFAGGVHRYYEAGEQRLGVHQFYAAAGGTGISSGETQEISGLLVAYLKTMGVDPLAFTVSASAGPDGMFWLSVGQAEELRLATNGRGQTTAELKQAQGTTYLSVEQGNVDAMGRFLFFCSANQIMVAGGYVTTTEDTRSKFDWLTWSALKVGNTPILSVRKLDDPSSVQQNQSMISVFRKLTRAQTANLLSAKSIGMIFGADGMVAYGASADLSPVIEKVKSFVTNCYQL